MRSRLLLSLCVIVCITATFGALVAWADARSAVPMPAADSLDRNGLVRAWSGYLGLGAAEKLQSLTLFDGRIYAHTSGGALHVFDGETGRTIWEAQIGEPGRVSFPPAVNSKMVFVVNGSTLYAVNRDTGRPEYHVRLTGAPSASPAANDEFVYVPFTSGVVHAYKIGNDQVAFHLKALNSISVPPLATRETLAVASQDGDLYISHADAGRLYFRFHTTAPVVAPLTRYGRTVLLSSADYNVYALNLAGVGTSIAAPPPGPPGSTSAAELGQLGEVLWRFPSGDPILLPSLAIGDRAYVTPENGGLYQLDFKTGLVLWHEPSATRFVAASHKAVYALDRSGNVVALDVATGSPRGVVDTPRLDMPIGNDQTDRIYLGSRDGFLVCLRETQLTKPLIHRVTVEPPLPPKPVQPKPVEDLVKEESKPKPKPPVAKAKTDAAVKADRKTLSTKAATASRKPSTKPPSGNEPLRKRRKRGD